MPAASSWLPLVVPHGSNQHYWNPQTNAAIEVLVLVRDRAGNIGEDKTTVSLTGTGGYQPPPVRPQDTYSAGKNFPRKYVNTRQVSLSYDLKEVGPSGVSAVELWYTLYNVRSWNKLNEYPIDLKNTAELNQSKKLTFEVNDEGIYGITLVAKSGVGLGDQPPKVGDPPQFWIEVDLTKPVVEIQNVIVGRGIDKGKLTISWSRPRPEPGTESDSAVVRGPKGRALESVRRQTPEHRALRLDDAGTKALSIFFACRGGRLGGQRRRGDHAGEGESRSVGAESQDHQHRVGGEIMCFSSFSRSQDAAKNVQNNGLKPALRTIRSAGFSPLFYQPFFRIIRLMATNLSNKSVRDFSQSSRTSFTF